MELWPGYYTSMRQHENEILLMCDLSFKFMKMDNVYDMLMECRTGNVKQEFASKVIGTTVITGYNNKSYRIDDVDFDMTPQTTFAKKDGSQISFIEYYKQRYNIKIQVSVISIFCLYLHFSMNYIACSKMYI